jgi:hypothetical protein
MLLDGDPVATEDFVTDIFANTPVVNSFNGRSGPVQLTVEDVLRAGALPQINPAMAGVCTAPTIWNPQDSSDLLATTAFVQSAICDFFATGKNLGALVASWNGRGGDVILTASDITFAATQPNARPQTNTPSLGDYSKQIANTQFVTDAIDFTTAGFAPLNSPRFTGIPTSPTAPAGTNSAQIATTAFVGSAVTAGLAMGGGTAININTLTGGIPLVGDGATDNFAAFSNVPNNLYNLNQEWPVAVSLSSGPNNACVVTWLDPVSHNPTAHNLKPNQAFFFTTTAGGSLPPGITPNTPYFITFANLTANTFTFSTVNNTMLIWAPGNAGPAPEGTPLPFGGSPSGVNVVLTGKDWINIYVPPGCYATHLPFGHATNRTSPYLFPAGISRVRFMMYGAIFDDLVVPSPSTFGTSMGVPVPSPLPNGFPGWTPGWYDFITTPGGTNITNPAFVTVPLTSLKYYIPGQWVIIMSLDVMNYLGKLISGPADNQYFEYNKISSINASTGQINLKYPWRQVYVSTLPNMWNGVPGSSSIGGGRALIAPMSTAWDMEYEIIGGTFPIAMPAFQGKRTVFIDCKFDLMMGSTASREVIYRNCFIGPQTQVDKLMEYVEFDSCEGYFNYVSGPSCIISTVKKCRGNIGNTPRKLQVEDSIIDTFAFGNVGLGTNDSAIIRNTYVSNFGFNIRGDGPGYGFNNYGMTQLASWTLTNGTLSRDLINVPQSLTSQTWAVPGAKMVLCDEASQYENMGASFMVLNVYKTGTAVGFPLPNSNALGTLGSGTPGLTTFTLVGGTFTTPATFTGTIAANGAIQYGSSFTLISGGNYSVFPSSPAAITGGGLVGAQAYFAAGTVINADTTLRSIPTSQVITPGITAVNGAATTFTGATIANGTPVILQPTVGAVFPTGINPFANYWVVNTSANTFQLASSYNGAAIVGTGTPSGSYNVVTGALHIRNHPCPRFTGLGNSGHATLVDLNGAVDEPIFSRFKRVFSGFQNTSEINFQYPTPRIWGNLVTMTVNVLQPATGVTAGTAKVTITCPTFVQPNLTLALMTQVIDLTVAGVRTITATTATGPAGTTDVIAAVPNWMTTGAASNPPSNANNFSILCSGLPAKTNLANQAVFSVEVITDQGMARFANNYAGDTLSTGAGGGGSNCLTDTSVVQYWPQNP